MLLQESTAQGDHAGGIGIVDSAAGLAQLLVGPARCGLPGPASLVKNSTAPRADRGVGKLQSDLVGVVDTLADQAVAPASGPGQFTSLLGACAPSNIIGTNARKEAWTVMANDTLTS